MAEVSAKSFLGLLQKSGLCDQAELKSTINRLFEKAGGSSVRLDQLTEHLLGEGLISEWHIKKLTSGKYKGFFLGKYKLIRHLGTGGMSSVYLAQHTIFNQQRAIKVLPRDRVADKTYLERFYREGRAAAALNHKNIVRVYDIGNEGSTHYLVMEYVKGEDIYEMVKRDGPLSCDKSIDFTIQMLTGLQHAHEIDLVHRDIKPANLLVTPEGDVKILDLGLALFRQEEDASLTVMHNERVLGTADYLSPEQAVDSHKVDLRADIYSAGCTLYFMLTGKPPFHEGSIAQRIAKHQTCEPDDILDYRKDCPGELLEVVQRMMKKKAEDRYQDCEQLAEVLREIADNLLLNTPVVEQHSDSLIQADSVSIDVSPANERKKNKSSKSASSSGDRKGRRKAASKPDSRSAKTKKPVRKSVAAPKPVTEKNVGHRGENRSRDSSKEAGSKQSIPDPGSPSVSGKSQPARRTTSKDAASPQRTANTKTRKTDREARSGAIESPVTNIDFGKAGSVDASQVSVVVSNDPATSPNIGVNELRSFVSQNRTTQKQSAKPKRDPLKKQMMLIGLVVAMLLLLGLVLVIAIKFVSIKNDSQATNVEETSLVVAEQRCFSINERLQSS